MPPNFKDQLLNLQRRRGLAESLRQRGLDTELGQTNVVSGRAIANPAVGNVNAILQQLLGTFQANQISRQEKDVREAQKTDRFDFVKALQANKQPDEIQSIGIDPSGFDTQRLSSENIQRINKLNEGVVEDRADEATRKKNERFELLLSGLDKGGFAEAIAGTELANILGPKARKTVPGVPGITTDGSGNFFDTSGNPLSSEQIQSIATGQRLAGASRVSVTTAESGKIRQLELARRLRDADISLGQQQAMQQAGDLIAQEDPSISGIPAQQPAQQPIGQQGFQATGFEQIPEQTQQPEQAPEQAAPAFISGPEDNPNFSNFITNGQLNGGGESFLGIENGRVQATNGWASAGGQKDLRKVDTANSNLVHDIDIIRKAIDKGLVFNGVLLGTSPLQFAGKILDELGFGPTEQQEFNAALKRLQTAGKLEVIGESGVRAFDTPLEMKSLFESLANESMNTSTLLVSLKRLDDKARENLRSQRQIREFINAVPGVGNTFQSPEIPEIFAPRGPLQVNPTTNQPFTLKDF